MHSIPLSTWNFEESGQYEPDDGNCDQLNDSPRSRSRSICTLTFDRPDSGANIFDAATLKDLSDHVTAIENDSSLKGVIIASAKKSIFIAGADLQTLLRQAMAGEMRAFIAKARAFSIAWLRSNSYGCRDSRCMRRRRL